MMTTMTTPANVSDQLMGLYGPEQLREVERLSTYNYRARWPAARSCWPWSGETAPWR